MITAIWTPREGVMKQVTVRVSDKMNLEQSQKLLAAVLGKVGHPNCVSGFKISFENAVDPANVILVAGKDHVSVHEAGG
jgi:hypothetical protein